MGRNKDWRGTWDRIEALFDRVGGMGEAEREAYLAECDAPPEVIAKVRELLASDQVATEEGFLSPVMSPRVLAEEEASPDEAEADSRRSPWARPEGPSRFGPYRVIEEIGRGGMGVVYLAERDDGAFEQRVAIKMVSGAARQGAHARFSRERQILADLSHPNIARLLGGGTAENGEPYLVMEWIDGLSIDRYCEQNELSTRRRLELLAVVCDAVQAAHQRLIVHRDIKPSNVLVDQDGQVKLLDFGIATLLDASGQGLTATGARLMTPQYASPEQLRGEAAGVATDIYQLGLLAYELLTGTRPYELADVAPAEAMRLVLDDVPTPPSAVTGDGRVAPRGPLRELNREIDALVGKALDKEPARRYASADRLREDIERYLAGLPISARPATFGYQLGKLVRRHAYFFGFAAAALAVMVTMAVLFTQRVIEERNLKEAEAERAESLLRQSEGVSQFLVDLFEAADPNTSRGETVTARDLLDRGADRLQGDLSEQPLVRARLMHTIGKIYSRLGLYGEAEPLFDGAARLQREHGAAAIEEADSLRRKALVAMLGDRRLEDAEPALDEARRLVESVPEAPDLLRGRIDYAFGVLRRYQSRYDEAEASLKAALGPIEASGDEAELAALLSSLGSLMGRLGRHDEALDFHQRSVALGQKIFAADDARLARYVANLSTTYSDLGQPEKARPLLEQTLETFQEIYGEHHIDTLTVLQNLAVNYLRSGELEAGAEALSSVATRLEALYGPRDLRVGIVHFNLGNLALERERPSVAEERFRHALAILEGGDSPGAFHLALMLGGLGEALRRQGHIEEAEVVFRRALDRAQALGSEHAVTVAPLLGLARVLDEKQQWAEAGEHYRRAVEISGLHAESDAEQLLQAEEAWRDFERRRGGG